MKGMNHSKMERKKESKTNGWYERYGPFDDGMGNQTDILPLNYSMLKSPIKTMLPAEKSNPRNVFWTNGKHESLRGVYDGKGISEVEDFTRRRTSELWCTMPPWCGTQMHLHGHDFRVINGQENTPRWWTSLTLCRWKLIPLNLRHHEGDWFFCHIYTMMAGMNRVISYEDQAPEPFLPDRKAAYDKPRKKTVTTWWPKNDFTTREWWYGNASEYAMEHRNRVEVGL
jgi:hypothetical protein